MIEYVGIRERKVSTVYVFLWVLFCKYFLSKFSFLCNLIMYDKYKYCDDLDLLWMILIISVLFKFSYNGIESLNLIRGLVVISFIWVLFWVL